jgi:hypothetical protein
MNESMSGFEPTAVRGGAIALISEYLEMNKSKTVLDAFSKIKNALSR